MMYMKGSKKIPWNNQPESSHDRGVVKRQAIDIQRRGGLGFLET